MMAVIVVPFGVMFVLVAIIITLFTEIPGAIGEIRRGKMAQIHYEEELKKFKPSLEVEEIEEAVYQEDLSDMTDLLKQVMDQKK